MNSTDHASDHTGHGKGHGDGKGHGHGKQHGHGYEHQDPADWIPGVELDAKISIPPVLHRLTTELDLGAPGRILDVGCGPGIGTTMLANHFTDAEVIGLDVGEAVLDAAMARARADGLSDRVRFIRADFDRDVQGLFDPVDLVFASMSLHHTENPGAALGRVSSTLTPGGRLVVAEFGRPLSMFPAEHEVVTSGLWDRWQAASEASRLDHLGEASVKVNWLSLLLAKGLDTIQAFEAPITSSTPTTDLERAWLAKGLARGLQQFGDRLDDADRSAIAALLDDDDPEGVANSPDVLVDTARMIYTGLRP